MLIGACAPPTPAVDVSAVASRYIQLARDLARHDPSLVDHWLVEPPADEGPRRPVYALREQADALVRDAEETSLSTTGTDRDRTVWLQGQARALRLAAVRLLGESLPFDAEARLAFGITPTRADQFQVDRAREVLERELPGAGLLAARLSAFRVRFQVGPGRRDALMWAALEACRVATRAAIPLPEDESVEVGFVEGLPWDAHARYLGHHRTRIDVRAGPLDLTRALRLACHEGYAGHHAQHIWAADDLVAGRGWQERALVPGFGPALLVAEGAAEAGADLAFPADHRPRVYLALLAAAGLDVTAGDLARLVRIEEAQKALEPLIADIARDYLDNRITAATAIERLEQQVLVPDAERFLPFIERRRTRVLAYGEGRRLAGERLGRRGLAGLKTLFVQ
jgi:hypothetical protein